jgi:hypothetical protein
MHKTVKVFFLFFLLLAPARSIISYEVHQSEETLRVIQQAIELEQKGVYFRFGDGEILTAAGTGNSQHQPFSHKLHVEMQECFSMTGEFIFKCLPLYHPDFGGYEDGMGPGNHYMRASHCGELVDIAKSYWGEELQHIYSHVALSYLSSYHPVKSIEFLLFLKKQPRILLVGNKHISSGIRELLLGDTCGWVPAEPFNAYKDIDQIEEECVRQLKDMDGYAVVVTAMGVSGKILQKRLHERCDNVFLFDFGSLMDALTNAWEIDSRTKKRRWIEVSGFNAPLFIDLFKEREREMNSFQE